MSIAPGAWREVALSDIEYEQINALLGREPSPVELGMFGAMWSEHCGYKHSRPLFRHLSSEAPWVLQGPGENAGAVDIGDGLALVFKVESHNHPSAVEPFEGAATGVGGIVRDIFTMGARPVAILDGLRFGPLDEPRNRYLFDNVVGGIGGYGNCLGIPTVGGDLFFDEAYNGNPLVNAMCAGIVRHDKLTRAGASGAGNVLMLIGAETGRDGLHGATFASVDDPETSHRGVVQVGNPFLEKLLLEACLELLDGDDIVAMQDLGAAGLTSSVVETASRGGMGADLDVSQVPRREADMTAYEVMLSESQERMLLVVRPDGVGRVSEVVNRWSLHSAVVGHVTDDGAVRIRDGSEVVVDVRAHFFTDDCPTYEREAKESNTVAKARSTDVYALPDLDSDRLADTLVNLLRSPNISSRRPVFERYDHTILTDTVVPPGEGDAAVLRIKGSARGLSLSLDCNSRYCWLDPKLGAMHAVAEAARNVSCTGGRPLGLTNCLNFGNPEKPGSAYQLREAVIGIGEAGRALGIPVISGNVSLYNETADRAVLPTPMIGVVGVLKDVKRHATMRWHDGDTIVLLGGGQPALGGSEYVSTIHGVIGGSPPDLDLTAEAELTALVRSLISSGVVRTAHDVGLGGLAVSLAEMAMLSGIGADITRSIERSGRLDTQWFGESATRVLVAIESARLGHVERESRTAGVPIVVLGRTGGDHLRFSDQALHVTGLAKEWERALL